MNNQVRISPDQTFSLNALGPTSKGNQENPTASYSNVKSPPQHSKVRNKKKQLRLQLFNPRFYLNSGK